MYMILNSFVMKERVTYKEKISFTPTWWLTPVIPALGRPRLVDYFSSGVRDHLGQYGETLSLLKIQKLSGHGGACL